MRKNIRSKDRIGTTIAHLQILNVKRENKRTFVYCKCMLYENKKWLRLDGIVSGDTVSCGCYNINNNLIKPNDITNKYFGRLHAITPTNKRSKGNGSIIWKCECHCGNTKDASEVDLALKRVTSCGCYQMETCKTNGKALGNYVKENHCVEGTNIKNLTSKLPKNNLSGHKGVRWECSNCL